MKDNIWKHDRILTDILNCFVSLNRASRHSIVERENALQAIDRYVKEQAILIAIDSTQPGITSKGGLNLPPIKKKLVSVCDCSKWKRIWIDGKPMCSNCGKEK